MNRTGVLVLTLVLSTILACRATAVSDLASQHGVEVQGGSEANTDLGEDAGEEKMQDNEQTIDPYSPTYGPKVEVEALYLVEPAPGSKRLQAAFLRLDSGEEWILSYRPVEEELQFFEKRVVVQGRTYTPSPLVQHVSGSHFEMESIELAPGATPHDPIPSELPTPPMVKSLAEMHARSWRWVHVQGKLVTLNQEQADNFWADGVLQLDNGERVTLLALRTSDENKALVGLEVTAMGRVVDKTKLSGRVTLCEGRVPTCLGKKPMKRKTKRLPGRIIEPK